MSRSPRLALLLIAVVVALAALWARSVHDQRVARAPYEPHKGWISPDPDSLYHMRRTQRALDEGLPPASSDAWLDFPGGSAIPWPPYYTFVTWAASAPFAPEHEPARAHHIEQRVASLPWIFGSLTSVLCALAVWSLLRGRASGVRCFGAALAGMSHAWSGASIAYSGVGNGDHHAWVTLLFTALLLTAFHALESARLDDPRGSLRRGAALGALCGLLIGSWVGALVYATLLELALGLALFAHARRARAGLAALGLAMHVTWALALAPAVLASPWKDEQPWMMVNLSWLHLAHPLLGALVFAPLVARAQDETLRRRWPWIVGAALLALFAALALGDFALARSVREGFAWASRNNTFMAFISESQPLAWGPIGGWSACANALGFGLALAPLAALWIARESWRNARLELALLALLIVPLTAQALTQQRFAEALAPPLALALAFALADWSARVWRKRAALGGFAGVALALALQSPTVARTPLRLLHAWSASVDAARVELFAKRELYEWLERHTRGRELEAVLASWDHGHALEWVARRASVGTNFGSYVGEDSYLDPWRFFLEEDPRNAEALLELRRARHVLITGDFSKDLEVMLRLLKPEQRRSYLLIPERGPVFVSQRFFPTLAGRLMMNGRVADLATRSLVGPSLDFLRLVHVSPNVLAGPPPVRHTNAPVPVGWIWERVRGAELVARGASGESVRVELELEYPQARQKLTWIGEAQIGPDGVARLRMPYSTDGPNGDALVRGAASWRIGARSGTVSVPEAAVQSGASVEL